MRSEQKRPPGRGAEGRGDQVDAGSSPTLPPTRDIPAEATPYQLLPPLSADEYAALLASIAAEGIRVPIQVDEHGQILDGHHRAAIAAELGIDCPRVVVSNLDTETAKRTVALSLNLSRRHLNREQTRQVIAASIQADPDLSDREHARRCGCSPTTVGTVRRGLLEPNNPPVSSRAEAEERLARIHAWLDDLSETLRVTTLLLTDCGVPFAVADEMVRQLDRDVREMVCADPPRPWAGDYIAQRFADVTALVPDLAAGAR